MKIKNEISEISIFFFENLNWKQLSWEKRNGIKINCIYALSSLPLTRLSPKCVLVLKNSETRVQSNRGDFYWLKKNRVLLRGKGDTIEQFYIFKRRDGSCDISLKRDFYEKNYEQNSFVLQWLFMTHKIRKLPYLYRGVSFLH